ncbi:hypothetical protein Tco_0204296 [Tanacetum coccineum]
MVSHPFSLLSGQACITSLHSARLKQHVSTSVKEIDNVQLGIVNQVELKLQPRAFFSFCTAAESEVKILPNLLRTRRADAEEASATQPERLQLE